MYTFCTLKSNLADRPDISFHLGSAGNALERMNFTSIISGQLSYPTVFCPILQYGILSYPMVSCPILWYPVLSYPIKTNLENMVNISLMLLWRLFQESISCIEYCVGH